MSQSNFMPRDGVSPDRPLAPRAQIVRKSKLYTAIALGSLGALTWGQGVLANDLSTEVLGHEAESLASLATETQAASLPLASAETLAQTPAVSDLAAPAEAVSLPSTAPVSQEVSQEVREPEELPLPSLMTPSFGSEGIVLFGPDFKPGPENPEGSVILLDSAQPRLSDEAVPLPRLNLAETAPESSVEGLGQLSSVNQLADVRPTDWAYQALKALVERYNCVAGYPDGLFRGSRAITRYEAAALVNSCLDRINELIADATDDMATQEDLAVLQRLAEDFQAELATLRGRVIALDGRLDMLEAQQFSTTTRLFGQAIMGAQMRSENTTNYNLLGILPFSSEDQGTNASVLGSADLTLFTQLSPQDILLTTLHAGVGTTAPRQTNDVLLSFEGDSTDAGGESVLQLSEVSYRRLLNRRLAMIVGPAGVNMVNVFRGANRIESSGYGPLSRFAQRNPIKNIGAGTAGLGLDWQASPRVSVQTVYSANSLADDPSSGIWGGTDGGTTAGLQVNWTPINRLDLEANYVYSYSPFGTLSTGVGDDPIMVVNGNTRRAPMTTHAVGGTLSFQATDRLNIGGWAGYTTSESKATTGSVETINWMAFMSVSDLLGEGNLLGFFVGQPPKITSSDLPFSRNLPEVETGDNGGRPGTTTHVEAFFRYRLNNHIAITPGVIAIFNPRHNPNNDTILIGAVRTTFSF